MGLASGCALPGDRIPSSSCMCVCVCVGGWVGVCVICLAADDRCLRSKELIFARSGSSCLLDLLFRSPHTGFDASYRKGQHLGVATETHWGYQALVK